MNNFAILTQLLFTVIVLTSPFKLHADEEQPKYSVVKSDGSFQIRQYEPYFVAQTKYNEKEGDSSTDAFRRLFRYIAGDNKLAAKIEMTAPVTQEQSKDSSVKIEMTAPVTMDESKEGSLMTFMVPSRFSEQDIPQPTDPKVTIEKIPSRLVAVHTFSWFSGPEKRARIARELKDWLSTQPEYTIAEGPIYAGYNSPFSLPNMRTHEMMFVVTKGEKPYPAHSAAN